MFFWMGIDIVKSHRMNSRTTSQNAEEIDFRTRVQPVDCSYLARIQLYAPQISHRRSYMKDEAIQSDFVQTGLSVYRQQPKIDTF